MIQDHPVFLAPSDRHAKIWRYMDMSKFLDLLQRRSLYFSRVDQLDDEFEGSYTKINQLARDEIAQLHAELTALEASDGDDKKTQTDKQERRSALKKAVPILGFFENLTPFQVKSFFEQTSSLRRTFVQQAFVSCWHMNEHESAAMWKLYSQASESICVQSRFSKLAAVLPSDAFAGMVKYIDYTHEVIPEGNLLEPFMHKRKSFEYEREIRALLLKDGSTSELGISIPVDLSVLIERIYIRAHPERN